MAVFKPTKLRPWSRLLLIGHHGVGNVGDDAMLRYAVDRLRAAGLEASMSRKGNPCYNAVMECFNATYKRECVGLTEERGGYATAAEATADFFDYVERHHNRERRHSALGCQTPVDFENRLN